MASADLNQDGRPDFVVVDAQNLSLYVLLQGPDGFGAGPSAIIPLPDVPRAVTIADMDGDGIADIGVLGTDTVWVLRRGHSGGVMLLPAIPAPGAVAFAVGELSGDRASDFVLLTRDGVEIRFNRPGIPQYPALADRSLPAPGASALAVADVDGNGRADIVVSKPFEVAVYLQDAPGVIRAPTSHPTAAAGAQMWLEVQDVRGDGRSDIVLLGANADGANGTLQLLLQTAESAFAPSSPLPGPFAGPMAVGDVNGDGQTDLVVGETGGRAAILPQSADGSFAAGPMRIELGDTRGARAIRVGPFHATSWGDIAIRVRGWVYIFAQEDSPPRLSLPIPSTFAFNENDTASGLLDLREFYTDDHGSLSFGVVYQERPGDVWAILGPDGYRVSFGARPGWHGRARFAVSAWDGILSHPPVVSNTFAVTVNAPPTFASEPPGELRPGTSFAYQPEVRDPYPEDDTHTFALVHGPPGMSVDPATGLVKWTPRPDDAGSVSVALRVRDAFGGVALQAFALVVLAPSPATQTPLYAAAGLSALLAGLGAGSLVSENLKYVLVNLLVPLYTKIKREQVLDHFVRGQIYGYVLANPGEHYNAIKQALGLTNGSLAHHLKTLEREQFLKSRRFGLYRRFYPIHMRIPDEGYLTLNTIQRTIAQLVQATPGITQKEIAARLNLTPPTVNYHIGILQENRVIHVVREGRATHCFVLLDAIP